MTSSRRLSSSAASRSGMEAVTAEEGLVLRLLRFLEPEDRLNYFRLIAESARVAGYSDLDSLRGLGRSAGLLVLGLGMW